MEALISFRNDVLKTRIKKLSKRANVTETDICEMALEDFFGKYKKTDDVIAANIARKQAAASGQR